MEPIEPQGELRATGSGHPTGKETSTDCSKLLQLLRQALASLGHLRERAGNIAEHENPADLGYNPRPMKNLCKILDHGCGRIERRMAILAGTPHTGEGVEEDPNPTLNAAASLQFMEEYRACCQLLCKGLTESQRISSAASSAMLSDFVLALEKQLWLIDPGRREQPSGRYRGMSFLLTC